MNLRLPICDRCKHYLDEKEIIMCCEAFPDGIPVEKCGWKMMGLNVIMEFTLKM